MLPAVTRNACGVALYRHRPYCRGPEALEHVLGSHLSGRDSQAQQALRRPVPSTVRSTGELTAAESQDGEMAIRWVLKSSNQSGDRVVTGSKG